MKLDLEQLAAAAAEDTRVVLAMLFGSSRDGNVRPGSDVDMAVLFAQPLSPVQFFDFYVALTARLPTISELDLVDLNSANTILAFEALKGRRLFVRDPEQVADFFSYTARQYEDDMLHARAS